eukprot:6184410-Pleurochrysis_carterae.AAC.3
MPVKYSYKAFLSVRVTGFTFSLPHRPTYSACGLSWFCGAKRMHTVRIDKSMRLAGAAAQRPANTARPNIAQVSG